MMNKKIWMVGLLIAFLLTLSNITAQPSLSAAESESAADVTAGSALKGVYHLSHVVKIYVPSTVHGDTPIPKEEHDKLVDQALTTFSDWFGGATAVDGIGAWVDDDKKLIKENVTIVYAFAEKLDKEAVNQVVAYAKKMKEDLTQSSISLEVDGKMYFIE